MHDFLIFLNPVFKEIQMLEKKPDSCFLVNLHPTLSVALLMQWVQN